VAPLPLPLPLLVRDREGFTVVGGFLGGLEGLEGLPGAEVAWSDFGPAGLALGGLWGFNAFEGKFEGKFDEFDPLAFGSSLDLDLGGF